MVPLILLNMLIAIMGDTYDRVKEEQGRRDFQEMAGLIYRYESIAKTLFKRDKGDTWKYIFVSQDVKYQGEEAIDVWQGRIKGIKLQIERYHKKQEQWQDNWKEEWQNKNEDWQKKNEN